MCKIYFENISYEPATGLFYWETPGNGSNNTGDVAGNLTQKGYLSLTVSRKGYMCHRLAWCLFYGKMPARQIDHINGVKRDNRIINLRDVSNAENNQNKTVPVKGSSSSYLGVSKRNEYTFIAQITTNGENLHLGSFRTPEEAHDAYVKAKRRLHKTCTL